MIYMARLPKEPLDEAPAQGPVFSGNKHEGLGHLVGDR